MTTQKAIDLVSVGTNLNYHYYPLYKDKVIGGGTVTYIKVAELLATMYSGGTLFFVEDLLINYLARKTHLGSMEVLSGLKYLQEELFLLMTVHGMYTLNPLFVWKIKDNNRSNYVTQLVNEHSLYLDNY